MQHYKAPNNELHSLSDDDIANGGEALLPAGSVPISDAEAATIRSTQSPLTAEKLMAALTAQYESLMLAIASGYPPSERESWPVQMEEAKALLANAQASTPWIDAAAQARGLTRTELATRIAAKNAAYRVVSGTLTGVRQAIEDQITAAGNDPQALAAIDVAAGWPN